MSIGALALSLAACGGADSQQPASRADSPVALGNVVTIDDDAPIDYGRGSRTAAASVRERAQAFAGAPVLGAAALPPTGPEAKLQGAFGEAFAWPIIPIHLALLPDGRVMAYGTDETGNPRGSRLKFAVWDPAQEGADPPPFELLDNTTATQIFCATQVLAPTGGLMVIGGTTVINKKGGNGAANVNQFDAATDVLSALAPMSYARWYASAVTLGNGAVVVLGGRMLAPNDSEGSAGSTFAITPELFSAGAGWRTLDGASSNAAFGYVAGQGANWNYPRAWLAPSGAVLTFSDDGFIYALDASGSGALTQMPGRLKKRSVARFAAMYAPGKLLLGRGGTSVQTVDLNGALPQIANAAPLSTPRMYGSGTLLADGEVWVNGGSTQGNTLAGAVYTSELWNPATDTWRITASAAQARLYHSNALLLPDATVLTGGGGSPGPIRQFNGEIYYPPYLFNADGSWASRPSIVAVSAATAVWGQPVTLEVAAGGPIGKVSLLRLGSATHALNNEQRYLDLAFTQSGSQLEVTMPPAPNQAPPGYYMVFVFDDQGVPSRAKIIRLAID